jgi:hypothetical protein
MGSHGLVGALAFLLSLSTAAAFAPAISLFGVSQKSQQVRILKAFCDLLEWIVARIALIFSVL